MGVIGDDGALRADVLVQGQLVEFVLAAQGGPAALVAPEGGLLFRQDLTIPVLNEHADAAGDQERAAIHPRGLFDPHVLVDELGVLGL